MSKFSFLTPVYLNGNRGNRMANSFWENQINSNHLKLKILKKYYKLVLGRLNEQKNNHPDQS